jgi:hypothetical protein
MGEEIAVLQNQLDGSVTAYKTYFPAMKKNAEACVALLGIHDKVFTIAAEYDAALDVIGKVKPVMEAIEKRRKEISGALDSLKQELMIPEKDVKTSFDAVKKQCDVWNQKIADAAKAEQARIEREKKAALELVELESKLTGKVETFLNSKVAGIDSIMIAFFSNMQLDTFETSSTAVRNRPVLQQGVYDTLFTEFGIPVYGTIEQFQKVVAKVKAANTFETVATRYTTLMQAGMKPWIEKLPSRKVELENMASLGEKERAAALAAQKDKDDLAAIAAEQSAKLAEEVKAKQLEETANAAKIGVEFSAQIATQMIDTPTGVRNNVSAVFDCEEKDVIVALTELVYTCITHPKHPGIYKKDKKTGEIEKDISGDPVYVDWLDDMMKFYANNCPPTIPALKIVTKVTTVARKK